MWLAVRAARWVPGAAGCHGWLSLNAWFWLRSRRSLLLCPRSSLFAYLVIEACRHKSL